MAVSWLTALPATYSYILQADSSPAIIPFAAVEAPLCGATLTYAFSYDTGATAPAWISAATGTHLELTPNPLSPLGIYAIILVASEPISGKQSSVASIEITLTNQSQNTAITAASIPD